MNSSTELSAYWRWYWCDNEMRCGNWYWLYSQWVERWREMSNGCVDLASQYLGVCFLSEIERKKWIVKVIERWVINLVLLHFFNVTTAGFRSPLSLIIKSSTNSVLFSTYIAAINRSRRQSYKTNLVLKSLNGFWILWCTRYLNLDYDILMIKLEVIHRQGN